MKSKKGFSLVELMIVVVIMAILVAVAVPIYNSVTANARTKTCLDNQRTIINSLGNHLMLQGVQIDSAETFYVVTEADGEGGKYATDSTGQNAVPTSGVKVTSTMLNAVFQTVPYCPTESSWIKVVVNPNTEDAASKVVTDCNTDGHELNSAEA
ncbi:MAG: prepilin-type N-terminal cleavage/methylation domain-containing protein [Ruminococcaceae bacterium]|nr:prepilin-type N-terminal cleavage/methylation domain-containing protein [Oscillospiraceae bacterium]